MLINNKQTAVGCVIRCTRHDNLQGKGEMIMNLGVTIAAFVGMFVGILVVAVFLKFTKTDKSAKWNYDERQKMVRGKGYEYGFFSMLILNVFLTVLRIGEIRLPVKDSVIHFMSIVVGVGVYAGYCILKDGYFALNENKKAVIVLFVVVGILNLLSGVHSMWDGSIIENGMINENAINLLCAMLFLGIFIVLMIKRMITKRAED